jgi:hypothetical protein
MTIWQVAYNTTMVKAYYSSVAGELCVARTSVCRMSFTIRKRVQNDGIFVFRNLLLFVVLNPPLKIRTFLGF